MRSSRTRISTIDDHPSISFGFHGGLIKRGPGNVLHQTEYTCLSAEMVKLRVRDFGMVPDLTQDAIPMYETAGNERYHRRASLNSAIRDWPPATSPA